YPEPLVLPEALETVLQISRDNTYRMIGMVNAILDMSRLESGQMTLLCEPVELAEIVERSCAQQGTLASRSDTLLLNDVSYDLPRILVDQALVSRIFQNLIDNALKFSPPGGSIEISARLDDTRQWVWISVKDSGPGIPEDLLGSVFDKYITGANKRRGTGLGLAFCKMAVEAHGGKIEVINGPGNSPTRGTIFHFSLPVEP
ncbi:MAG: sensor histidine kinase, partial [Chloroflexota bacterium]